MPFDTFFAPTAAFPRPFFFGEQPGAAREHRGGEERGEDVEVVSGTKGARVDFFAARRRRVDSRRRGEGTDG